MLARLPRSRLTGLQIFPYEQVNPDTDMKKKIQIRIRFCRGKAKLESFRPFLNWLFFLKQEILKKLEAADGLFPPLPPNVTLEFLFDFHGIVCANIDRPPPSTFSKEKRFL